MVDGSSGGTLPAAGAVALVVLASIAAFGWCRAVARRWGTDGRLEWSVVPLAARLVTAAALGVPGAMAEGAVSSWVGVAVSAGDVAIWAVLFAVAWLLWWRLRGALFGPPPPRR